MEHQKAIESMAAERYVLGELTEEETNDFEEHYFDCRECAESVRNGAKFIDSGKAVVKKAVAPRRWRLAWAAPSAVAAMMTVFAGYQQFVQMPRMVALVAVEMPGKTWEPPTRAVKPEADVIVFHGDEAVTRGVAVPPEPKYPSYRYFIRDESGKTFGETKVKALKDYAVVAIRPLPAGRYEMVIQGVREDGNHPEVISYPFVVRVE
ncbi:MAG TPA: zf-HC2 domain-containing protein [Thermoanaerobaculia bacterium]|nr:zf-HC2 domain-containing protein [Thermoanaerobaculia bacterium]